MSSALWYYYLKQPAHKPISTPTKAKNPIFSKFIHTTQGILAILSAAKKSQPLK